MFELIQRNIEHSWISFIFWGYGWKRRICNQLNGNYYQWRDPLSGLWYRQPAAVKLLRIQLVELNLDP
ncbi:MAG: hypothetical protein V3V31_03725 [Methylococcales bacterium]